MIRIKRIYEPPDRGDGFRILVERLWPRGMTKERARVDLWLREIAPRHGLRKWFAHDPARWAGFQTRYRRELAAKEELLDHIRRLEKENGTVTLLFAARDPTRNSASVLAEVLRE